MRQPAYIAIAEDGHLTLYAGDGTDPERAVIARGSRASSGPRLIAAVEALRGWAWDQGYEVVTPAYDLEAAPIVLDPTPDDLARLDPDEINAMFDDLDQAE